MPLKESARKKENIVMSPFADLMGKFRKKEAEAAGSGGAISPPSEWKTQSGIPVSEENCNSTVYAYEPSGDFGFVFSDPRGSGRFTVFVGDLRTMTAYPLTTENQFYSDADGRGLVEQFLLLRITFDDVMRANEKSRGGNIDAIIRFVQNRQRSGNLVTYRRKMRGRQYPLKVSERFDFLSEMLETKQITLGQLEAIADVARALECAADPDKAEAYKAEGFDAEKFSVTEARRQFIAADSGVDPD